MNYEKIKDFKKKITAEVINFRSISGRLFSIILLVGVFWISSTAENVLLISVRLNNMDRVKRTLTKHFWITPFFCQLMVYQSTRHSEQDILKIGNLQKIESSRVIKWRSFFNFWSKITRRALSLCLQLL